MAMAALWDGRLNRNFTVFICILQVFFDNISVGGIYRSVADLSASRPRREK